uniref:Uncharacterized protein n=1 Tax=Oryza brachyantha TaxID=4533 RepID=J3N8F6_ORYBR
MARTRPRTPSSPETSPVLANAGKLVATTSRSFRRRSEPSLSTAATAARLVGLFIATMK